MNEYIEGFQITRGLKPDGVVGPKTWEALKAAMYYPAMPPFGVLSPGERIAHFGNPVGQGPAHALKPDGTFVPDLEWRSKNIVQIRQAELGPLPAGWEMKHGVSFHQKAVGPFLEMWRLWRAAGLFQHLKTWNGSTVYRMSRSGSGRLSSHAFGIAFDVNAAWNGFGRRAADVGEEGSVMELITIANACGWFWGGHFGSPDAMHLELADLRVIRG